MTEANDIKKYNHLKGLIAGNYKSGNSVLDELIVSDAQRRMKDLLDKRPKVQFETPIVEEVVKETKSKGKK